jgi:hypothetical protein
LEQWALLAWAIVIVAHIAQSLQILRGIDCYESARAAMPRGAGLAMIAVIACLWALHALRLTVAGDRYPRIAFVGFTVFLAIHIPFAITCHGGEPYCLFSRPFANVCMLFGLTMGVLFLGIRAHQTLKNARLRGLAWAFCALTWLASIHLLLTIATGGTSLIPDWLLRRLAC